ncbi:MAG: hypothetical protein AAB263_21165, partial [Planctomycetota bacterium]
ELRPRWLACQVREGAWPTPTKPLTPDGWIPGLTARRALVLLVFTSSGYDHQTVGRNKKLCGSLVATLLAEQTPTGAFATDRRDHALVLTALAEIYGLTMDAMLRPALERGRDRVTAGWSQRQSDVLWEFDTTATVQETIALTSLAGADITAGDALSRLLNGLRTHLAGPGRYAWFSQGHTVPAPTWAVAGVMSLALALLGDREAARAIPEDALHCTGDPFDQLGYWWASGVYQRADGGYFRHVRPAISPDAGTSQYVWNPASADDGSLRAWAAMPPGDRWMRRTYVTLQSTVYYIYGPSQAGSATPSK